jgi:hypothetical protein
MEKYSNFEKRKRFFINRFQKQIKL